MKVKSSLRKLCDGCKFIRRNGRLVMICSKSKRHKARQN